MLWCGQILVSLKARSGARPGSFMIASDLSNTRPVIEENSKRGSNRRCLPQAVRQAYSRLEVLRCVMKNLVARINDDTVRQFSVRRRNAGGEAFLRAWRRFCDCALRDIKTSDEIEVAYLVASVF